MLILGAVIIAAAIVWSALRVSRSNEARRQTARETLPLVALFGPAMAAAAEDPKALLTWQPLAVTARTLFPEEFAALDRASGGQFPFTVEQLQAAHARWTADWLAWEGQHDVESKLKTAMLEQELGDAVSSPYGRARLDAAEREKLQRYQRRYEEYSRVARALQALVPKG